MTTPLKLRAEDEEDLKVIAACLQDALIPLSDIHFQEAEQRFILVANRFRWENCPDLPEAPRVDPAVDGVECVNYERVNCGILFENVSSVRRRGLDQRDRGRILELLTMDVEADGSGRTSVVMLFAGGAAIRLEGEKIKCRISDIGEPWPTQFRPTHSGDDAAA